MNKHHLIGRALRALHLIQEMQLDESSLQLARAQEAVNLIRRQQEVVAGKLASLRDIQAKSARAGALVVPEHWLLRRRLGNVIEQSLENLSSDLSALESRREEVFAEVTSHRLRADGLADSLESHRQVGEARRVKNEADVLDELQLSRWLKEARHG